MVADSVARHGPARPPAVGHHRRAAETTPMRSVSGERARATRPMPPSSAPLPTGHDDGRGRSRRAGRGSRRRSPRSRRAAPARRRPRRTAAPRSAASRHAALLRLVHVGAARADLGAEPPRCASFVRSRLGDEDGRRETELRGRPGGRRAVVAGRRGDDAVRARRPVPLERRQRATPLERSELVDVLALEIDGAAR